MSKRHNRTWSTVQSLIVEWLVFYSLGWMNQKSLILSKAVCLDPALMWRSSYLQTTHQSDPKKGPQVLSNKYIGATILDEALPCCQVEETRLEGIRIQIPSKIKDHPEIHTRLCLRSLIFSCRSTATNLHLKFWTKRRKEFSLLLFLTVLKSCLHCMGTTDSNLHCL